MKTTTILALVILLFVTGCSTIQTTTNGIDNFRPVDLSKAIYRGGQPTEFTYLKSLGVSNIVKLNLKSEGSDDSAVCIGMKVVYDPINSKEQFLGPVPMWKVDMAVTNITPGTYVHCLHGQDRTGLIVAKYEIVNGQPKEDVEKRMLSYGFHKLLFGLWNCFKKF